MTSFAHYRSWDGIVTKRYTEPTGTPPSVDPTTERYDIIAVNTPDNIQLPSHLPLRRISQGARIIPAEVGDPCKITYNGSDYFAFMLTEGIPFAESCP